MRCTTPELKESHGVWRLLLQKKCRNTSHDSRPGHGKKHGRTTAHDMRLAIILSIRPRVSEDMFVTDVHARLVAAASESLPTGSPRPAGPLQADSRQHADNCCEPDLEGF